MDNKAYPVTVMSNGKVIRWGDTTGGMWSFLSLIAQMMVSRASSTAVWSLAWRLALTACKQARKCSRKQQLYMQYAIYICTCILRNATSHLVGDDWYQRCSVRRQSSDVQHNIGHWLCKRVCVACTSTEYN